MKRIKLMVSQMNADLDQLGYADQNPNPNGEKALKCAVKTLAAIQDYIVENNFRCIEDEVCFFKNIRPSLSAQITLIHFMNSYQCAVSISDGMRIALINKTSAYFEQLIDENYAYVVRMQRGIDLDDHELYVRHQFDAPLNDLGRKALKYGNISTYHSLLLEELLAKDLIEEFLNNRSNKTVTDDSPLEWTDKVIELVELIYSIHSAGSINNGKANINDIVKAFEGVFSVKLGKFYRAYLDLKKRQEPTTFLDKLRNALRQRMIDENGLKPS